jgi:hypothetical protein
MFLGHPGAESIGIIEDGTLSHVVYWFSNLYSQEETGFASSSASPVPQRDALTTELASLAQKSIKHSFPPRGRGDRIGGTAVQTENCLFILMPLNLPM